MGKTDTSVTLETPKSAKKHALTATIGLDGDAEKNSHLCSIVQSIGFDLRKHHKFSALRIFVKNDSPDLVILCGSHAGLKNHRAIRNGGYAGWILAVLDDTSTPTTEFLDAGADDAVYFDSWPNLRARVEAAKWGLMRKQRDLPVVAGKNLDSSERLQSILDTNTGLLSRYGRGGILTYVSESICKNYGTTREELVGQCIVDYVAAEDRAYLTEKVARSFEKAEPFILLQKAGTPSEPQWIEWYNVPILNQHGQVVECQGIGRDITEKVLLAERLRIEQEHLRLAILASNTVTWSLDIRTQAITTSENARDVLGFIPKTLDASLSNVVEEDREAARQFMDHASKTPGDHLLRLRLLNPTTGGIRWIKIRCSPVVGTDGCLDRLYGVCFDITNSMLAEQQLVEKGKMHEQLANDRAKELSTAYGRLHISERFAATGMIAARIAHELNAPIAGIRNAFYLIRDALDPRHRHYEYIKMIEDELDRLIQILRQLFILYGPEGQKLADVDIRELLEESRKMMAVVFSRDTAPIYIDAPADLPRISVAPGAIRQVLYNVLINALKASPKDQSIAISARQEPNALVIRVKNGGDPIPLNVQAMLFEPFCTRQSGSLEPGLGLGLYISRCLMTEIGGEISIESTADAGTTAILSLPVKSK